MELFFALNQMYCGMCHAFFVFLVLGNGEFDPKEMISQGAFSMVVVTCFVVFFRVA